MPTRYRLPHIDIAAFKDSQPYTAQSSNVQGSPRERAELGRRLSQELNAAFKLADALRPDDPRLPETEGTHLEVTLARGVKPDVLDRKSAGIRAGAAQREANNESSIILYVPDEARPALEQIIDDYLNRDTPTGNPRHQP